MRIGVILIAIVLLGTATLAWADFEQDKQHCVSGDTHPDIKIGACTRLIQSGRFGDKNLSIIFSNRGVSYKKKGQYDRAIQDYDQAIRLNSSNAGAFYNRGVYYDEKGRPDRAIQDYDQAIGLNPREANFFYNRGNSHQKKGQYDRAIQDYDQAIRLKPKNAFAFGNRGAAYEKLGRRDQALRDYKKQYELGSRPKWLIEKLKKYGALP